MDQDTPAALRLASELDACPSINYRSHAAELRRQHAEIGRLTAARDALRSELADEKREREAATADCLRAYTKLGALRAHRDRVRRLTPEEIDAIEDGFSNEFGLEAKYSQDFARAIETALAAKWGVALDRSM